MVPSGSSDWSRRPSNGPGSFWKNHQGTPFWTGTTIVPSSYSASSRSAIAGDLVRLQREDDDVLRAEGGEVV